MEYDKYLKGENALRKYGTVIQDKIQDNLFVLEKLAEELDLLAVIIKAGVADLTEGSWQDTNQSLEKLFRQSSYKRLKSF